MRILFISWWWPYPANNGSKLRIYHLLRQLATRHEVILLSFAEPDEATPEQIAHLRQFCAQVETLPKVNFNPGSVRAMLGYLSRWPRSMIDTHSKEMVDRINHFVTTQAVDLLIVSETDTLRYLDGVKIPAILDDAEITRYYNRVSKAPSRSARFRAWLTLFKVENMMRWAMKRGIAVTVVSEIEEIFFKRIAPAGACIEIIPNGIDTGTHRTNGTSPQTNSLIYPGAITYDANYDAVAYFIRKVLPLVRQRIPDAHFTVTGGTGHVDVSDLATQPGVTFTGYLPEVAPMVKASWITVVPLQYGGGTRLKILESMALGTPVVSTSKGAEGLHIHPGEDILIADDPANMADTICQLLENDTLRRHLMQAGRALVEREYDWAIIGHKLLDLIDKVAKKEGPHGK